MIRFKCKKCGQRFKVTNSLAGKNGKCHKCGMAVLIPLPDRGIDGNINTSNIPKGSLIDSGISPDNEKLLTKKNTLLKKKYTPAFIIIALCLSTLVFFIIKQVIETENAITSLKEFSSRSRKERATEREEKENKLFITAYEKAKDFVKSQLKSPYSAKFPPIEHRCEQHENHVYEIISYVDSQNEFGAMIRNDWRVRLQRLESHDWNVLDGNIGTDFFNLDVEEKDDDTLDTSLRLKSLFAKKQALLDEMENTKEMLIQTAKTLEELKLSNKDDYIKRQEILIAKLKKEEATISSKTYILQLGMLDIDISGCTRRINK